MGISISVANSDTKSVSVSKLGTPLLLNVRNKNIETSVTKMPFVPSNYFNVK